MLQFSVGIVLILQTLFTSTTAGVLQRNAAPPGDHLLKTVYQFPNLTWVENIAVRSNGKLLVTLVTSPEVWQIDPTTQSGELLYHFPNATSATGISEVSPDVFAVAVGNTTDVGVPGTWSVWKIDLNEKKANITKVVDVPSADFLNGNTPLTTLANTILLSDSSQGVIYRVNVVTGAYSIVISDPAFAPNPAAPLSIGINGIKYKNRYVYFDNTFASPFFARIPVSNSGEKTGPVEVIAATPNFETGGAWGDDFALDQYCNAWITTASSTLVKVTPEGTQEVIAGGVNSTSIRGSTSAAFGRTGSTKKVLYITTNGGLAIPTLGIVGGKVLSLDTSKL